LGVYPLALQQTCSMSAADDSIRAQLLEMRANQKAMQQDIADLRTSVETSRTDLRNDLGQLVAFLAATLSMDSIPGPGEAMPQQRRRAMTSAPAGAVANAGEFADEFAAIDARKKEREERRKARQEATTKWQSAASMMMAGVGSPGGPTAQ